MKSDNGLKGALIGFGYIGGKGHIPAYLERSKTQGDVEIVAVADVCDDRRFLAREALPQAQIYTDFESLIDNEAHRIDFVDISTPPCDHARIAQYALKKGLHVLCEKPLTTHLADAKECLEEAKRCERVLFPCHNYKHAPVVKAVSEIVDSGRIGKILSLHMNTYRNTHAKGVEEWQTDWRRQKQISGGGIAMDHGSHSFYLTFDWMKSYPTHVSAFQKIFDTQWDTEDFFSASLAFPQGVVQINLSWTAAIRKVTYSLQGETGAVLVDDDELTVLTQVGGEEGDNFGGMTWQEEKLSVSSNWKDSSHVSWFNSLFDKFKQAIEEKDYVSQEAIEAYKCIEIITTAYESSSNGSALLPLQSSL